MGERPLRALHVLRSDYATHTGGDLVQVKRTVAALIEIGVDAQASTIADYRGPDPQVVHLYNLQRPFALGADLAAARTRWPGSRVVVSPIFWPLEVRSALLAMDPSIWRRAVKTWVKNGLAWATCRHVVASVDGVLPNAHLDLVRLGRYLRLRPDDRWTVVPNGVDVAAWPPRIGTPDRHRVLTEVGLDPASSPVIACVARIEPGKNQLALVRAAAARPGAAVILVGPASDERYLSKVQRELASHGRRMVWLGSRNPTEVAQLLGGVDIHVLPSLFEIPGLASLEAAAVGCEIVVTAGGSTTEYFGPTAHVAASPSARAVGEALDAALTTPLQPATRDRVAEFAWSESAAVLASVYHRLAARSSGQPSAER